MKQKVFLSMNDYKIFFLYDYPGLLSQHGMITALIPRWNFSDNTDVRLRHGKQREGPHKSLRGLEGADARCQSPKGGRPGVSTCQTGGVQGVSAVVASLRHFAEWMQGLSRPQIVQDFHISAVRHRTASN